MKTMEDVAELVERMPHLDKDGTLTGPEWTEMEKACEGLLAAGREGLVQLAGMIAEVDDGKDYKARYVLHGMALYLGRPGKEKERAHFSTTLASLLGGGLPKPVKAFLARELQVAGGREAVPALGKLLADDELCDDAAHALLAIRDGAVEEFRRGLPGAEGRRRLVILQALGALADAASAEAFRKAAGDADRDVRLAALRGLARIADAGAVEIAIKASDAEPGWERVRAAAAALLLADNLAAARKKSDAARIYRHLARTRTDASEAYLQEIAEKSLAALGE